MDLLILLHKDKLEVRLHHSVGIAQLAGGLLSGIVERSRLLLGSRVPEVSQFRMRPMREEAVSLALVPVHVDGSMHVAAFFEPHLRSLAREARALGLDVQVAEPDPHSDERGYWTPYTEGSSA